MKDSPAGDVFDKTQGYKASPGGKEDHHHYLESALPHLQEDRRPKYW